MKRSLPHIVNAILLVALFIGSLICFHLLPHRIPIHFNLSGLPDRFAQTTLLQWLLIPIVTVAVVAVLYLSAWLTARYPAWINVPNQTKYDTLNLTDKRQVTAVVARWLYWMAAGVILYFMTLQFGAYQVSVGTTEMLPYSPLPLIVLVLLLIGSLAWLYRKIRLTIKASYRQHRK